MHTVISYWILLIYAHFQSIHRLGYEFTKQTNIIFRVLHINLIVIKQAGKKMLAILEILASIIQFQNNILINNYYSIVPDTQLDLFHNLKAH